MNLPKTTSATFLKFAAIGVVGFAVDAIILTLMTQVLFVNIYGARLVSFSVASFTTWLLNRQFTFARHDNGSQQSRQEYVRYMTVQIAGSLANLAVFLILVALFPRLQGVPVVPLAVGALFGLAVTFNGSRLWVFASRDRP